MRPITMIRYVGSLVAAMLAAGCATTTPDEMTGATKTHYTLKLGEMIPNHAPLPARTNIQVTWHYSNGASESLDGYRGWDFDGDQRFEMVEVMGADGKVQTRVYDFDGDGRIDLVQ